MGDRRTPTLAELAELEHEVEALVMRDSVRELGQVIREMGWARADRRAEVEVVTAECLREQAEIADMLADAPRSRGRRR